MVTSNITVTEVLDRATEIFGDKGITWYSTYCNLLKAVPKNVCQTAEGRVEVMLCLHQLELQYAER